MNLIELRNKVIAETVEKEKALLREELPGLLEEAVRKYPSFGELFIFKNEDGVCCAVSIDEEDDLCVYLPATIYGNLRLRDIAAVCEDLEVLDGCAIDISDARLKYVHISYGEEILVQ